MQTSKNKLYGDFSLQRKKQRSLFGASHNLLHGIDPLPLPQRFGSHLLLRWPLNFLQDTFLIIHVAII
jgi:hypothetical protein